MQNQIISLETAKLTKEGGFMIFEQYWYRDSGVLEEMDYIGDESLSDYLSIEIDSKYNIIDYEEGYYFAPSQGLLQKWLREVHDIHIFPYIMGEHIAGYSIGIGSVKHKHWEIMELNATYESVLEIGLQKGLNLIK